MTIQNKTKLKRYTLYVVVLVLAHLFQNSIQIFPEVLGVRPVIIIPLALCIAMYEGEFKGALVGLFAGALWDTVTVTADGYNAAFLMIMCAACGMLLRIFWRNNIITFAIINAATLVLYFFTRVLFFYVAQGVDGAEALIIRCYLPMALYSFLLTPLWFVLVGAINKKYPLNYMEY